MTFTPTVPTPTLSATGYVIPEESAILTAVCNDLDTIFGGNLNLDPTVSSTLATPQGQLASSFTAAIADMYNQFGALVNQVDPRYSDGRMQDGIGRIYFLERLEAVATQVVASCVGAEGTVITAGDARARDTSGNIYVASETKTIPSTGTITVTFVNVATGPIECPAYTLTSIYGAVSGWDTVINTADGAIGRNVETQQEFELRRQDSVAGNGHSIAASIYAAVAASGADLEPADTPTDVYVRLNNTDSTVTVGTFGLKPHSVYVAAVGGDPQSIGEAIWSKLSGGCDTNGDETITVSDTSGYSEPYPTYEIHYQVPDETAIKVQVRLVSTADLPSNITTLVKSAVTAAALGEDGDDPLRIASAVYASRFYAPVQTIDPSVKIVDILVGTSSPDAAYVSIGIDQFPTITNSDVTVVLV